MRFFALIRVVGVLLALTPGVVLPQAAAPVSPQAIPRVPLVDIEVVARYPHDAAAFTQGLIWRGGALYESVGREGRSDVRRVRLADGKVEARSAIPSRQFGEGLAAWKDELISLTWHDGVAHRWDARTLRPLGRSRFAGEGWGLTSDGRALIQSDGTPVLRFLDPVTLKELRRVSVTLNGRPLDQLNELEWVDGAILANVWHTQYIVRIDPATGKVTAVIDLGPVVAEIAATDPEAVANGIAYDPQSRRLFVTGKLWPTLFEVRIADR